MDELGQFLAGLPQPIGPMVTALLPVAAIGGLVVAVWAYTKRRRGIVVAAAAVAVISLIAMAAFITTTSR